MQPLRAVAKPEKGDYGVSGHSAPSSPCSTQVNTWCSDNENGRETAGHSARLHASHRSTPGAVTMRTDERPLVIRLVSMQHTGQHLVYH